MIYSSCKLEAALDDSSSGIQVYNITAYMNFHPGGADQLRRGAGKDCTALFMKYHAWVNAEMMLQKCLIGVLAKEPEQ